MNLAQVIAADGTIIPEAASVPIKLIVHGSIFTSRDNGRTGFYRPLKADEKRVLAFILAGDGVNYGEMAIGCKLSRERVNTICHMLMRRELVTPKGTKGKQRYWGTK